MTSGGTVTTPVVHVPHASLRTYPDVPLTTCTSRVGPVSSTGAPSVTALRTTVSTCDPGMECVLKECEEECVDTIVYSYDGAS